MVPTAAGLCNLERLQALLRSFAACRIQPILAVFFETFSGLHGEALPWTSHRVHVSATVTACLHTPPDTPLCQQCSRRGIWGLSPTPSALDVWVPLHSADAFLAWNRPRRCAVSLASCGLSHTLPLLGQGQPCRCNVLVLSASSQAACRCRSLCWFS